MTRTDLSRFSASLCIDCVRSKQEQVHAWLSGYEQRLMPPIYSSVDIRDAGFKVAVVDTNLFPAGFNNLCEHGQADAVDFIRKAIHKRVPGAQTILIVTEDHTRNPGYLENVRILREIIGKAGFKAEACMLKDIDANRPRCDLILMNNDLTTGVPENLRHINTPIYPSTQAGWHSRLKSRHFSWANALMAEFGAIVGLDPWFFSCFHEALEGIDINAGADRAKLAESAERLFQKITAKYKEHGIDEKPFVFVKSDSGTYGMGVLPIEHPDDLIGLNHKNKNKLHKGKSAQVISRFLLQEGVSTIHEIDGQVSEVCVYQIDNALVGGFYRLNTGKSARENLNSPGMNFKKMCPHLDKYGRDCGIPHDLNIFDIYRIIARVAGIAARMEIIELEKNKT